jgi:hypothetical protein
LSTGLLDFWQHNAHRATVVTKHTDDALDWGTLVYREHLGWVADGTALLLRARTLARKDDRSLAEAMSHARAEEYRALAERARRAALASPTPIEIGRAVKRLRKDLRTVQRRDYFPPAERDDAVAAVSRLAEIGAADALPMVGDRA